MPPAKPVVFEFGGVDSRSNPANYPVNRSLRCRDFTPQASGALQLRYGYSWPEQNFSNATETKNVWQWYPINGPIVEGGGWRQPPRYQPPLPPSATNNTITIHDSQVHSAVYLEIVSSTETVQELLFGIDKYIYELFPETGAIDPIGQLQSSNRWGHFRAANSLYVGNGVDFFQYDGTMTRPVGIPAPTTTDVSNITVSVVSDPTNGSFATTSLGGYQLGMVYYNPNTGHVGNYTTIGLPFQITNTSSDAVVGGLPNLAPQNPEWVKGFGMSNDGGQVVYWLVDVNGNRIVANNTATNATIFIGNIDPTQALPTRNTMPPPGFNRFANVGQRIFALDDNINNGMWYSESITDITLGSYVGNPQESWPGDNFEFSPTGEWPTAIQSYRFEAWLFSKNQLAIWSTILAEQGANPWRGPWDGGCAGQRAFVMTPYGPFWLTPDKQMLTWTGDGSIPVSEEYEAALLGQIGDQYIATAELAYLKDPELLIDCIYVLSFDDDGDVVFVVHDFRLRDERSPNGQAYEYLYGGQMKSGLTVAPFSPSTFVGAGFTPRQNMLDTNFRQRLWVGSLNALLAQLEDGSVSDGSNGTAGGSNYTGDFIGIQSVGLIMDNACDIQVQGDTQTQMSYSFVPLNNPDGYTTAAIQNIDTVNCLMAGVINLDNSKPRYMWVRLQLPSHPADGNFALSDPPFSPMPVYGRVNEAMMRPSTGQPLAR